MTLPMQSPFIPSNKYESVHDDITEAFLPDHKAARTRWPWLDLHLPKRRPDDGQSLWPKVTIVTPSFNQGQFLEETIRSVLLQDYPNLEYLIIDGGSTDNSIDIIRKYEEWLAYWVSEQDGGQADAINKGLRKSTGEYLGWINSDDILYPSAISKVVDEFRSEPKADFIYGDIDQGQSIDFGFQVLHGKQIEFSEMLKTLKVPIPQQGSLWRRSVNERIGFLDARWHVVLDREFYIRVAESCKLHYLPEKLGFFRSHEQSKSISQGRRWLTELPEMYTEFFERSDLPDSLRKLESQTMGAVFLSCASIAHQCGETGRAARFLLHAFTADPLSLFRSQVRSKIGGLLRSLTLKHWT
jgi:hypothetical protein